MADQTDVEHGIAAFEEAVDAAHHVLGNGVVRGTVARALLAAGAVQDQHDQAYADQLIAETGLAGMNIEDGEVRLRLVLAHGLAAKLTLAAKTILDAQPGAENYVQQEIVDRETGERYAYIIVRPGGKAPHQLRCEAEAELEALRRDVVDLRSGSLHRLVDLVPSGLARNLVAAVVAEVERQQGEQSEVSRA